MSLEETIASRRTRLASTICLLEVRAGHSKDQMQTLQCRVRTSSDWSGDRRISPSTRQSQFSCLISSSDSFFVLIVDSRDRQFQEARLLLRIPPVISDILRHRPVNQTAFIAFQACLIARWALTASRRTIVGLLLLALMSATKASIEAHGSFLLWYPVSSRNSAKGAGAQVRAIDFSRRFVTRASRFYCPR